MYRMKSFIGGKVFTKEVVASCTGDLGEAGSSQAAALASAGSSRGSSEEEEVAASTGSEVVAKSGDGSCAEWSSAPVHYFMMGPQPRWEEAQSWPPPYLAPQPLTLLLGGGVAAESASATEMPEGLTGTLLETGTSAAAAEGNEGRSLRWLHNVELWKCPKVGPPLLRRAPCAQVHIFDGRCLCDSRMLSASSRSPRRCYLSRCAASSARRQSTQG
jgi:hypothetical protein